MLTAGCFAAPPPAALPTELSGCHPGAYGARSEHRCRRDDDCLLCGERDGCGRLESRAHLALTNAACPPADPEACEGAEAACCGGRCVRSLGPPAF